MKNDIKLFNLKTLLIFAIIFAISTLNIEIKSVDNQVSGNLKQQEKKFQLKQNTLYNIFPALSSSVSLDISGTSKIPINILKNQFFQSLILYQYKNTQNQQFYIKFLNPQKTKIKIFCSQKRRTLKLLVHISNNSIPLGFSPQTKNNQLQQFYIQKSQSQLFDLPNSFSIYTKFNKVLDIFGGVEMANKHIIQWSENKKMSQVFVFREVPLIKDKADAKGNEKEIKQKYYDQLGQRFYNFMNTQVETTSQYKFQQEYKFNILKLEMIKNNISLPFWAKDQTVINEISKQDLPRQKKQQNSIQNIKENGIQNKNNGQNKLSTNKFCSKKFVITYMWIGNKSLPQEYSQILQKCKNNTKLIGEKEFQFYSKKWNQDMMSEKYQGSDQVRNNHKQNRFLQQNPQPHHTIHPQNYPTRQKLDLLKLLYLFYQGGIYSDFDTEINQKCFNNILTDQVIFTNIRQMTSKGIIIPEQNFIYVQSKYNQQIRKMLIEEIKGENQGDRWRQCKKRQCLIVNCQRHYEDRTYFNGYE